TPTRDESAERIEYVRSLLIQHHPPSVIKRMVRTKYRDLSTRTILVYMSRARDLILVQAREEKLFQRALSLGPYEPVIRENQADPLARIKAQERIDKLLGLEEKSPKAPTALLERLGIRPDEIANPPGG